MKKVGLVTDNNGSLQIVIPRVVLDEMPRSFEKGDEVVIENDGKGVYIEKLIL